jgi:hypothetical protein
VSGAVITDVGKSAFIGLIFTGRTGRTLPTDGTATPENLGEAEGGMTMTMNMNMSMNIGAVTNTNVSTSTKTKLIERRTISRVTSDAIQWLKSFLTSAAEKKELIPAANARSLPRLHRTANVLHRRPGQSEGLVEIRTACQSGDDRVLPISLR